jgi:protein kinase-like protein
MAFQFKQGDRPLTGYTIQRAVGRGGFGEVYYSMSDGGKEVALKFLRENPQIELRGVSHCLNLKSPYLVSIHDVRQNDEGDYFVIMEYVNGPSLRDLMNEDVRGLGPQKAAYLLREIAKGLAYLHDRGIVHRDLKPGNIFYEDGYVKIGDYGLAKIMAASQHSGQTVSVGTVHYMAPEVGSGNYDRTIDIYALGVILYEMLLGRVPFAGATMGEVLMKHLTAQPEVDELPEPFPHVIRKSLAKDPKDRYQTVNEMIAEVFSVPALDQSVATFEPASLSTVAARVAREQPVVAAIGGATITALGTGSSNVGQAAMTPTPVIPGFGAGPPGRLGRLHNRIGARVERMAGRIDRTGLGQQVGQTGQSAAGEGAKITIAFLLAAGISFGVSLVAGEGNKGLFAGIVFLHIVSIVQGVLIGTWWSYEKLKIVGIWVPRLIVAALACAGLLGSSAIADAMSRIGGADDWLRGLAVCMILGDWAGRFYEGRKGNVSLGSAFSIGLCGFVAGIIFTHGGAFETAAIAAAASLVVQAVGSLWPLPANAVVPKTASDEEEEESEDDEDKAETPAPVAVEPPGFFVKARVGVGDRATAQVPAAPAILAQDRTETGDRVRRNAVIRSFWLLMSALALCGSVVLFAAPHLVDTAHSAEKYRPVLGRNWDEDVAFFTMWGTSIGCLFLFLFTRSWSGYKTGVWRGIFRPAIFFGGLAMSACCGIAMGLLKLQGEAPPFVLGGILFGAISSLFVWFVPVAPYRPRGRQGSLVSAEGILDEQEEARRLTSRRLRRGAIGVVLVMVAIIAIIASEGDEEAIPPIAVIGTLVSGSLFYWSHHAAKAPKEKVEKLTIPLRRVFEVDANPNLSRLIERHLSMFGYRLAAKSDLLWSFERGNWAHQFWHSDVRQWKLKLNIAAYELDTGGYRMTCYLDMDASFNQPDSKQLAVLDSELLDLKGLLGGRDAPSGGGTQTA